jgi:putative transposase
LVFVIIYRGDVLSTPASRDLSAIFAKVRSDFGAELVDCSGEDDHVHLLVTYPPTVTSPKLFNSNYPGGTGLTGPVAIGTVEAG